MYVEEHRSSHCDPQYDLWWPEDKDNGLVRPSSGRAVNLGTVLHEITRKHFELALSRHFLYNYAYPPPSRWTYGLLGSLGRRHAQTPCNLGLARPRNVRYHQGHWSWSWPVWPQIEVYRVENPILQETELGEYLSHIVGGVCVFGLRLRNRTQCVLLRKGKLNEPTPWGI